MHTESIQKTCANPTRVKTILLLTGFFAVLNETSIIVALPSLMKAFGVPVSTIQWLVTGFMLVMAIVMPITAYILHSFNTRKIYFAGLCCLAIGSLLSGLAPFFAVLLIGRLIQALASCCLMALLVNTMIHLTPPESRGAALGLVGLVNLFSPAIAPSLAGLILQHFGWRWIFLGSLPFFLILGIAAFRNLKNITVLITYRLDIVSVILAAAGFGGLVCSISFLDHLAENFFMISGLCCVCLIALVLFVARQLTMKHPLLNLRVFRYPMFSLSMIMIFFSIGTVFGITMFTPMYLGPVMGLSTVAIGLTMLPGGVLNGLFTFLFGNLFDRCGPRVLIRTGASLTFVMILVFAFLPADVPVGVYIAVHCVLLISIAMVMTVSQPNGVNQLPRELYSHGTAVMNTLTQLAGGVGAAVYISIMSSKPDIESGFHLAFRWGALFMCIPLVVAFFVRRSHAPAEIEDSLCTKEIERAGEPGGRQAVNRKPAKVLRSAE